MQGANMEIEFDPETSKEEPMLFNLAPLIDCVFLLLIFFLLTSSFVERGFFKVELPEATAAVSEDRKATVITIERDGNVFLNGRKVGLDVLKEELVAVPQQESKEAVIVEADREVRLETLIEIMDILKSCGQREISIETIVSNSGGTG
jgi:biopolymer transport protein ExbD